MIDLFPSYLISPAQSCYDPATSPVTLDLQDDSCRQTIRLLWISTSRRMGTCCQGIRRNCPIFATVAYSGRRCFGSGVCHDSLCRGAVSGVLGGVAGLSLEGPFDVDQTAWGLGATPQVLDSLPGCQYRMTSYDTADRNDVDPAYVLRLHYPRFL